MLRCLVMVAFLCTAQAASAAEPQWMALPPTPTLPQATQSGLAPVNGIKIWYATFGKGEPVILLHGGLANSNYWGLLVRALAPKYRVIVMDSRGHGRSTRDDRPYGYDLMAADVIALMDFLKVAEGGAGRVERRRDPRPRHRAAPPGAADASSLRSRRIPTPRAYKPISPRAPSSMRFIARAEKEYGTLSPTPTEYKPFLDTDRQNVGNPNPTGPPHEFRKRSPCRPGSSTPTTTRRSSAKTHEFMASQYPRLRGFLLDARSQPLRLPARPGSNLTLPCCTSWST